MGRVFPSSLSSDGYGIWGGGGGWRRREREEGYEVERKYMVKKSERGERGEI